MKEINKYNIEEWLISELESELDGRQLRVLEDFLMEHPQYNELRDSFKQTVLEPDLTVFFENKSELKKREPGRLISLWPMGAATKIAAAIILVAFISTLLILQVRTSNAPLESPTAVVDHQPDTLEGQTFESSEPSLNKEGVENANPDAEKSVVEQQLKTNAGERVFHNNKSSKVPHNNPMADATSGHKSGSSNNSSENLLPEDVGVVELTSSIKAAVSLPNTPVAYYQPDFIGDFSISMPEQGLKPSLTTSDLPQYADVGSERFSRGKEIKKDVETHAKGGKKMIGGLGAMAGFVVMDVFEVNRIANNQSGFAEASGADAESADNSREYRIDAGPFKFYKRTKNK